MSDTPFLLPQGNFSSYETLEEADTALKFKQYGQIIYVISEDSFYYWDGDSWETLSAGGSSSGTSNPTVRYVYLVQDAADQAKMGGTAGNVYTTFQTAYNAANVLQINAGGIVVIQVGNITAAVSGDLTLTASWNANIHLNGISPSQSVLGNIIATNNTLNGFNVGSSLATTYVKFSNIRIGNISTNATGTTGTSGNVGIIGSNLFIGNISTAITNVANTTGSGGGVRYNSAGNNLLTAGNINTSVQGTGASAGVVNLNTLAALGSITTCNGVGIAGGISLTGSVGTIQCSTITYNSSAVSFNTAIALTNCFVTTMNVNLGNHSSSPSLGTSISLSTIGTLTLTNNGNGTSYLYSKNNAIGTYTSNSTAVTTAYLTFFSQINTLGNNSKLLNCVVDPVTTVAPAINGIGTGCKIYNTTIVNGSFSINNSTAVSVVGTSSVFDVANGANVTIT